MPKTSEPSLADQADKALKAAIRKLIAERKRAGGVLVVWRNGKVARVPAQKIRP